MTSELDRGGPLSVIVPSVHGGGRRTQKKKSAGLALMVTRRYFFNTEGQSKCWITDYSPFSRSAFPFNTASHELIYA